MSNPVEHPTPPNAPNSPRTRDIRAAQEAYLDGLVARLAAGPEAAQPWHLEADLPTGQGKLVSWLAQASRSVVIGPPGSGKTAAMGQAARLMASEWRAGRGSLPILVDLGEGHAWEGVEELAIRALGADQISGLRLSELGPCTLFLDNLHRSADVYLFEGMELLLRAGGQAGPGLVVGCRSADWPNFRGWFDGIDAVQIRPLDRSQLASALRAALPADRAQIVLDWLSRDPDLAQASCLPRTLGALLDVAQHRDPAQWGRPPVLETLLDHLLAPLPRTERAAFRSALVDVALQGLGQGALIQVDTIVMNLAVTRERMVRSGAVVPHGTALAFVEPLLATHLAAAALAPRAEQRPAALLDELMALDPGRRAGLLAAVVNQVSDPAELLALALDLPDGADLVARCLATPLTALTEGPRSPLGLVTALTRPGRSVPSAALAALADAMTGRASLGELAGRLRQAAGVPPSLPAVATPAEPIRESAVADDTDQASLLAWMRSFLAARERGLDHRHREDWQGAQAALVEAGQALSRLEAELNFEQGQVSAARGDHEAARMAFEAALARDPDQARYVVQYGRALIALDRVSEAIAALDDARERMPNRSDLHAALAQAYRAHGWIEEAGRAFAHAADLAPGNAAYQHASAELQAESGDLAAAERALGRALALRPREATWHDALGQILSELGRSQAALRAFERAHELAPQEASYLRHLGRAQLAVGRYAEAEASLTAACDRAPEAPGPLADLGLAQATAGRMADAVATLRRAVAMDGIWPLDHLALARALRSSGLLDEAADSLAQAGRLAPTSVAVTLEGQVLDRALREAAAPPLAPDAASDSAAAASAQGGPLAEGRAALIAGDVDRAIELAREVLVHDPSEADACALLGESYRLLGLPEAAMTAWEEAVRLAPREDRYRLGLAEAALAAGYSNVAHQHLEAAAERGVEPPAGGDTAAWVGLREATALADSGWDLPLALPELAPPLPPDTPVDTLLGHLSAESLPPASKTAARLAAVQLLGRGGRPAEALSAAEAAADQDHAPETLVVLAWARLLGGDGVGALESLGMARALGAEDAALDVLEGQAHLRRGDALAAETALKRAADVLPEHTSLQALRAEAARRKGDTSTAIKVLDRALARSPRQPVLQAHLGEVLVEAGQDEQALERFARASELDPDNPEYRVAQAEILDREGDGATARMLLSQVLERRPQHLGATLLLARISLAEGRPAEARSVLARALDRHPDAAKLHHWLGVSARAAGDLPSARGHLEDSARLEQGQPETYMLLGEVCLEVGETDEAIQALENAVNLDGDDLESRLLLAEACARAGLRERAREQLDSARALAPADARPLLAAGRLALDGQQPEQAIAALEAARDRAPQDPEIFHSLGLAYKMLREYDQATQMFRSELRLTPMSPKAYAQYAAVSAMHFVNRVVAIEDAAGSGAEPVR